MANFRAFIKDVFYRARLAGVLDYLLYQSAFLRNRKSNADFRQQNPGVAIPPDYLLYETYRLDYHRFFTSGENIAEEIISWTKNYAQPGPLQILDWGCGLSRVVMHIPKLAEPGSAVYACDINAQMIEFNQNTYKNVSYAISPYAPPTTYPNAHFDLIYALSVFTHIEASLQEAWVREIHRILKDNGVFLFTTHGKLFSSKLLPKERLLLDQTGAFTKAYQQKGHRMMSTYNSAANFRRLLQPYFEILEFHDGATDHTKTGGQDLWIVIKLPVAPV